MVELHLSEPGIEFIETLPELGQCATEFHKTVNLDYRNRMEYFFSQLECSDYKSISENTYKNVINDLKYFKKLFDVDKATNYGEKIWAYNLDTLLGELIYDDGKNCLKSSALLRKSLLDDIKKADEEFLPEDKFKEASKLYLSVAQNKDQILYLHEVFEFAGLGICCIMQEHSAKSLKKVLTILSKTPFKKEYFQDKEDAEIHKEAFQEYVGLIELKKSDLFLERLKYGKNFEKVLSFD